MFDRYTEEARRAIFFARYEASGFGGPSIETEHLLLGLLREDAELADRFRAADGGIEAVRKRIETATPARARTPKSVDLPLRQPCKRALAHAEAAAGGMGQREIVIGHLRVGVAVLKFPDAHGAGRAS